MIKWELTTRLPLHGKVSIQGRESDGMLCFDDPFCDSSIVLRVSLARANEIAAMSRFDQAKMNLRLERREVHLGREFRGKGLPVKQCPFCLARVTIIDHDFELHAIPWCSNWRRTH